MERMEIDATAAAPQLYKNRIWKRLLYVMTYLDGRVAQR